ncbi:MAG TPA: alpha/beta fold hydrolase [Dehalococcoidia bacterium]|nr:alpha/beta fold hydrolase [Dehalococcoidia bacterium]
MLYHFAEYELDTRRFELRRGGLRVPIEPQVFDVLAFLVENHDRVVTKDEIMEKVWGDKFISEAALNSRLMAARKAIGDSGREQRLIRTLHGRGFRFVGDVTLQGEDTSSPTTGNGQAIKAPRGPAVTAQRQTIRFCTTSDGVRIAYGTVGEGPPIVKAPNWLTHLEYEWQNPVWRHWWQELAVDHQVIRFDQRGCGLSDWDVEDLSFQSWVRDLETVVEASGVGKFALLGISQGGAVAIEYAVRHPEKVTHLILCGAYTRGWAKRGHSLPEHEAVLTLIREGWGRDNPIYRQLFTLTFMPEATPEQIHWFNELQRVSTSAPNAARLRTASGQIDVLDRLPLVSVPTLVLHARGDERVPFDQGRQLASLIPNARFVPLDSRNHLTLEDEPAWPRLLAEVRAFLSDFPAPQGSGV